MNVGRLLNALEMLRFDYIDLGIKKSLANLATAAEQAASSPTDIPSQEAFTKAVEDVKVRLHKATANTAPVSARKAIDKSGLTATIGENIAARFNGILSRQPFLLQQASVTIAELVQETDASFQTANSLRINLDSLGYSSIRPSEREFEFGLLFPTEVTRDDLVTTNAYLKGVERLIETIQEVVHGRPSNEIPIKSASSGTFELYLTLDSEGAKAIAILVSSLVGGFLAVKNAGKQRSKAEESGYPETVIDAMKEHENTLIQQSIDQAVVKVMQKSNAAIDDCRKKELETKVKIQVEFMSRSINQGVDVELSPPALPETNDETSEEENAYRDCVIEIKQLSDRLKQLTLELGSRDEPIAELPNPIDPLNKVDTEPNDAADE